MRSPTEEHGLADLKVLCCVPSFRKASCNPCSLYLPAPWKGWPCVQWKGKPGGRTMGMPLTEPCPGLASRAGCCPCGGWGRHCPGRECPARSRSGCGLLPSPAQPCPAACSAAGLRSCGALSSLHGFWWVLHPRTALRDALVSSYGLWLVGCFLVSSYSARCLKSWSVCILMWEGRVAKSFWASDVLNKQQLTRNGAASYKCWAVFQSVSALGVQWHDASGLSLSHLQMVY